MPQANISPTEAYNKRKKNNRVAIIVLLCIVVFAVMVNWSTTDDASTATIKSTPTFTANNAYAAAETYVQNRLSSPKDADFPWSDYSYTKVGDSAFIIKSYVDTKNLYNANVRLNWTARLKYKGGDVYDSDNWNLLYLSFDN